MNRRQKIFTMIVSALLAAPSLAASTDSYQERILFSPGADILESEVRGRIMIYDGLKNEIVEMALDDQFERIENMMFVRTLYVQDDGEYEAQDDCD